MQHSTDTLWRYMKLSTLVMLLEGKAWLPSIASLQAMDPLEGNLGDDFYQDLWDELDRQGLRDETEEWLYNSLDPSMQRFLGINPGDPNLSGRVLGEAFSGLLARRRAAWCWFRSDLESAGMWSVYGNRGIAVRTSIDQLGSSLPPEKEKTLGDIIYVDRRPCARKSLQRLIREQPEALLRPYFLKAAEYEHEGEVRLVAHCPDGAAGVLIAGIDVMNLINEVVISPLLPLEEAESIKSCLSKHCPDLQKKIKQSGLNGRFGPGIVERISERLYSDTDENMYLSELPAALRNL